jgi:hypothetical protein
MAPIQSVQADWLDVEDFGCVGVNNCNPATCTDTSAVDVSSTISPNSNNGSVTGATSKTQNLIPVTPFTCAAGEVEEEEEQILFQEHHKLVTNHSPFLFICFFNILYHTIPWNHFY